MGSRGIGKTESAKAFTQYLFGFDRLAMVFMNELKKPEDAIYFVQALRRAMALRPGTLLFDEIEKAHPHIVDIFISMLEEGVVTDTDGTLIPIGNCYVVLTSNLGASKWGGMEQTNQSTMERFAYQEAKKFLRPELFNRLTETIVFRPLTQDVQIEILESMVATKLRYVSKEITVNNLHVDSEATAFLLKKCFSQAEGARRLMQELDRQVNAAAIQYIFSADKYRVERVTYDSEKDQLVLQ